MDFMSMTMNGLVSVSDLRLTDFASQENSIGHCLSMPVHVLGDIKPVVGLEVYHKVSVNTGAELDGLGTSLAAERAFVSPFPH